MYLTLKQQVKKLKKEEYILLKEFLILFRII